MILKRGKGTLSEQAAMKRRSIIDSLINGSSKMKLRVGALDGNRVLYFKGILQSFSCPLRLASIRNLRTSRHSRGVEY